MAIVNTRNALVGWLVVKAAKRAVKKKAKDALPGRARGERRLPLVAGVAAAVVAVGAWVLLRRWRDDRAGGGGE